MIIEGRSSRDDVRRYSEVPRHRIGLNGRLRRLEQFRREVFPGIDELVSLETILLVVQLLIASPCGEEFFVGTALDDLTSFQHQNLIGAPNRREPVGNHKRCASATQSLQAVLNQSFALAVET